MEAERRQVTVLFTDMVGFTAFSEAAGEEAAFRLMQDVAQLTGEVVREQGGEVQNFTGDGVMAVFGAPVAYDDASLRDDPWPRSRAAGSQQITLVGGAQQAPVEAQPLPPQTASAAAPTTP